MAAHAVVESLSQEDRDTTGIARGTDIKTDQTDHVIINSVDGEKGHPGHGGRASSTWARLKLSTVMTVMADSLAGRPRPLVRPP